MKDSIVLEFFIYIGMLFQTVAPEYEKLFLNKLILGLGIMKFPLDVDLKFSCESFKLLPLPLIRNKSVK